MRALLFIILLFFLYYNSVAQIVYPYQDIKLEKTSDYKETEPLALSAANALLTTPFSEAETGREGALAFLTKWMTGAKEYQFYLKGLVQELIVDKSVLTLYVAAMVKYTLENKAVAVNPVKTEQQASGIVLSYCDDPKNNFKLKKKLRKLLEEHLPAKN